MNQLLMKQLLSFFVFLLLGCVKLSACTTNDFDAVSDNLLEIEARYDAPQAVLIPQDFIFSSVHVTLEQESKNIFTTDNEKAEEEVPTSVKKPTNIYAFEASVYFATKFVATGDAPIKRFHATNYVTYFPSNTIQILFCTFRI
ncbi:MAG: hypothetical protein EOO46_18550 [Flavobacterium sp.]|nr:MAG: hypothetical protein EOO46_18550 [Flavobacterium sp.]